MSNASLHCAIVRIAWWMRPPPRRRCASTLAPSSGPSRWSSGNAHVAVDDVVVVAGLGLDVDTRRVARHDEHAVRAHDEEDVGDASGTREPLLAVDHPLVAVTHRVGAEQVRVRSTLRLGHRVRRPHLLVEHRLEPALLLLVGAVRGEHLHVAGVGRGGSEHLRRRRVPAEDLVEEAELELAVPGPAEILVEEDRPESLGLDLVLKALHQRLIFGSRRPHGVGEHVLERLHLFAAELLDPIELLLELGLGREIPTHQMTPMIEAFMISVDDQSGLRPIAGRFSPTLRPTRVAPPARSSRSHPARVMPGSGGIGILGSLRPVTVR